ncbi:MAG TPA: DUF3667 domain-containing protein [Vicinamibacterales bacterium]|nr:DUF3667 domain-containing protein [Vicinamibacterales bacterium]
MTQLTSMAADETLVLARCPNCGAEATTRYCGRCGQKRIDEADLTVRHFLRHLLHEITEMESNKVFATLVALVRRPGLLTVEYLSGRKGRYVEPIRLYLTISAFFFLFAWGAQLDRSGFYERVPQAFAPIAARKGLDTHAVVEAVDHRLEKYAAVTRFASVLGSGLCLALLFRGTRRYYAHHLIFALHYISFSFLLNSAYALLFLTLKYFHVTSSWLNRTSLLVLFVYGFLAMRRVYQQPWPGTALKAAAYVAFDLGLFVTAVSLAALVAAIVTLLPLIVKL